MYDQVSTGSSFTSRVKRYKKKMKTVIYYLPGEFLKKTAPNDCIGLNITTKNYLLKIMYILGKPETYVLVLRAPKGSAEMHSLSIIYQTILYTPD